MGKIDSTAFCSIHNLKDKLYGGYSFKQLMSLNCTLAAVRASDLADENPDFLATDALYAFRAAMMGEEAESYATYGPYFIKYDNNLDKVLDDLMPAFENWLYSKSGFDQKAYGFLAFLYIAIGNMEKGNEILDLFLQQEEQGMKIEIGIWMPLCALADFERWHDNKYGNPIIGNTPSHNKNEKSSAYGSASGSTGGGCYIATAVYGSYDCPEVWTLRRYRDLFLAESWYGRMFIKLYYAVSPILVKWFGNTVWFKMFWKNTLNKVIENLQKQGYGDSPYKDQEWK